MYAYAQNRCVKETQQRLLPGGMKSLQLEEDWYFTINIFVLSERFAVYNVTLSVKKKRGKILPILNVHYLCSTWQEIPTEKSEGPKCQYHILAHGQSCLNRMFRVIYKHKKIPIF